MNKFIFLAIMLLFTQNLWSENNKITEEKKNSKEVISFDNYLQIINKKLPELKQNKIKLEKSKNLIFQSKGVDDFKLTGEVKYLKAKQYSATVDNSKSYLFTTGVQKIVSQTGTRVATSLTYNQTDSESTSNSTSNLYQPSVSVTVTQPLLYNYFGKLDRYSKKNSKMNLKINKVKLELENRSLINYYQKLYVKWLQYDSGLKILAQNIVAAKKLEGQVKRKVKRGLADNDEFQKSHSATLTYQISYENYKNELDKLKDELSIFFDIKNSSPDLEIFSKFYNDSLSKSFENINFDNTENSKLLKLTMNNLIYNLDINKNKQLPELNLVGSVTQKSYEDNMGNSFSKMNDTDYYVGINMSYALGNHENKGSLIDAELSIKKVF